MGEKRRARRWNRRLTVRYGEKELVKTGITADISTGGLYISTQNPAPPIDSRIHVQVLLDGERSLFFEGVVRRQKVIPRELRQIERGGFGVRFLLPAELLPEIIPQAANEHVFEARFATADELKACYARELRFGGIFIPTNLNAPQNAKIRVTLNLSFASAEFELDATVVHVAQGVAPAARGLGVTFDNRAELDRVLRAHLPT